VHQQRLGRIPRMVAADAGFYSRANEKAGQALGVRWMSVPNKNTTSKERKLLQHQRWFRRGQKWRTGSEGRISVLKRRHGLRRCLISRPGRHVTMGRAGRDCRQHHPDGVLSCATEHLSRYSQLASRSRMDERKITTQDHIRCT
jgi:hypothetical protein